MNTTAVGDTYMVFHDAVARRAWKSWNTATFQLTKSLRLVYDDSRVRRVSQTTVTNECDQSVPGS